MNNFQTRTRRDGRPQGGRSAKKRSGRSYATAFDINKMIHKGRPMEEVRYNAEKTFAQYPIDSRLIANIHAMGFTHPTEIQEKSFETISELRNVIGIATTGTGKTAAFLIPIINALLSEEEQFQTLVMVPTRELALQVEDEFRNLSRGLKLYITSVIGGQSVSQDIRNLRRANHIIVGTPGRLTDLTNRGALRPENFSVLILDEFDRMLDMGFTKDVDFLTSKMTGRDQTLLFSATIDNSQKAIIDRMMDEPVEIKVSSGTKSADHINQDIIRSTREEKFSKLLEMVKSETFDKVLVFAETKSNVAKIAQNLKQSGVTVDEIHGDKTQAYRQKALSNFKIGKVKVLVATDVAARGLDISNVTHVINYEMPNNYETYIHRIGRTGRAGKTGSAFTFVH
jgi:ATP-dependent RNA helicase RhlE